MRKERQRRGLFSSILLVLLLLVSITTASYAYWASGILETNKDQDGSSVVIGEGESVATTLTINGTTLSELGVTLVPKGYESPNEVSDIDLEFITVIWAENISGAAGAEGTLKITVVKFEIDGVEYFKDGNDLYGGMFKVTLPADTTIIADTAYSPKVNLEFTNEPINEAEYLAVANKTIVITFNLEVVPN